MNKLLLDSVSRTCLTRFLLITIFFTSAWWSRVGSTSIQELLRGFTAAPDPKISSSSFQSLISDSTGNYSLGFIRVNRTQLALAVVHVPSSEQLWLANMTRLPQWSHSTRLIFNGSLVISDSSKGVFWSTNTDGDRVWLSNSSNLLIQKLGESHSVESTLWQSFDFPSDTLLENQNFTSTMSLISGNGLYFMRLGSNFMGLYAKFRQSPDADVIYWKHKALEAKANVIDGGGPIYAAVRSNGFLGMYQNSSTPVDIQTFYSFQQSGGGILRVRLESDGNLKGYYWTGSSWVVDYLAISDPCDLPSGCGPYGLCVPGKGCSCVDDERSYNAGGCAPSENIPIDLCGSNGKNKYRVLRRSGLELAYKEITDHTKMDTLEECERGCEMDCSCWGAVYSNISGFCYTLDYPIQTLVGVGDDDTKVGFFKVVEGAGNERMDMRLGLEIGLMCAVVLVFGGLGGLGLYAYRRRKRGVSGYVAEEDGVGVGPYKNLESASFRSIELCEK